MRNNLKQPLETIDKENIGHMPNYGNGKRQYTPYPKKQMNGNRQQDAVTLDMLDCDGEKRVAMIVHNSIPKRSIRKLFSPLRAVKPKPAQQKDTSTNRRNGTADPAANPEAEAETSSSSKRPRDDPSVVSEESVTVAERTIKKVKRDAMTDYISSVLKVQVEGGNGYIYDSCPELVAKIEHFLQKDGVTRVMFLAAIDVHGNSLRAFLKGKDQEQSSNLCYPQSYAFFEKMRIHDGAPKTLRRLQNESYLPHGFEVPEKRKTTSNHNVHFNLLSDHVLC